MENKTEQTFKKMKSFSVDSEENKTEQTLTDDIGALSSLNEKLVPNLLKRSRGRPKKYESKEEAKESYKEQQKVHQSKYQQVNKEWRKNVSKEQKKIIYYLHKIVLDEVFAKKVLETIETEIKSKNLLPKKEKKEKKTKKSSKEKNDNEI
jgi:hypothetical protein